jgi:hypothetical protein
MHPGLAGGEDRRSLKFVLNAKAQLPHAHSGDSRALDRVDI